MTNVRKRAIKMYWKMAKKKCPFQTEEIVNGYLEGFIDCAEYLLLQIAELEEQIEKMKQERSAEVRQRVINEIVSAIEKDREEGV